MGQSQFVCAGSGNGLEQAVGNSPIRDGIDILIDTLNELGFDYLFGHTGGAVLPIYDRINSRIDAGEKVPRVVMYAQEPGAGHAAEGYAKVNCDHKPGLVLVTSGPGATNLVTPIADAYKDSVPVIFLTGQVPSKALGTDAFQEVPIEFRSGVL